MPSWALRSRCACLVLSSATCGLGSATSPTRGTTTSAQPQRPYRIHTSVGDGGRSNAAVAPPGPAIENPRKHREDDVSPVEMRGPLVEMRQAKEHRGH